MGLGFIGMGMKPNFNGFIYINIQRNKLIPIGMSFGFKIDTQTHTQNLTQNLIIKP